MIKDVTDYLEVTDGTTYHRTAANKIPAFKMSACWRFARVSHEKWIAAGTAARLAGAFDAERPAGGAP